MSLQVIEGTWEEIELHKKELTGRHLRVIVSPEVSERNIPARQTKRPTVIAQPKVLTGFGAFKGKIGSSEEFAREKRAEIELEERNV